VNVKIDSTAQHALYQAHYKAGLALKYADPVDEWVYASDTFYGGEGYADIANTIEDESKKKGNKPRTPRQMDNLKRTVENRIKSRRKVLGIE
jgi:hypothetical protein